MPTTNTQKIVTQKFFNDLASPVSLTADTWGPTDGHFLIQPQAVDAKVAVEFERISVLLENMDASDPKDPITSASIVIAIDPSGTGILWSGSLTLLDKSGGDERYGFSYPKQIVASSDIPAAIQTVLSTNEGQYYILLKTNVDTGVQLCVVDYSHHNVQQS